MEIDGFPERVELSVLQQTVTLRDQLAWPVFPAGVHQGWQERLNQLETLINHTVTKK